ncbi:zinc-dependent metalloprotease [uncultured Sanguibacteroides sp.]|uniref:zinc-dependent metalloprotease n=1 Tax=uncultured Sanguibacteroides sp. TaxID=1635151 RepID=UPI0025D8206A|nr:zinc-dependent metalloprotease [uncultured Sanguibacteroides sp.]
MRKIIYISILSFFVLGLCLQVSAKRKKKEETPKKVETPYQKFFKGKKYTTREGFVKLHQMDGKVYMEFPIALLNKDVLLTSSIEDISDNGEGVVGQFAGKGVHLRFTREDSLLQARLISGSVYDPGNDEGLTRALKEANVGGVFKSFKIEAQAPDKSAVLIDVTPLFLESSHDTNPFTSFGGNSMFGFVVRIHKFQLDRSFLKDIQVKDREIRVTCELGFDVDRFVFGKYPVALGVPVSVTVNKMLLLLPEEPMRPRLADARIGVMPIGKVDYSQTNKGVKPIYFAKRWKLEPVDEVKYRSGELVEPRKPIVFYLDSLMPEFWRPYIKAGAEEWNQAFEKIGFKNVIRVVDFPGNDPDFDANDIHNSTIRYSPSVLWMTAIQTSLHEDPRSGEILNASLYIHNNIIGSMFNNRSAETMGADPSVRRVGFSSRMTGEMLKMHVMQAVGNCLGLTNNLGASYAYPVDSLRSVTFTNEYGLSPSIMDGIACNYIAQPEDVKKGVRMIPKGLGPYDFYVIKWLYQPIPEKNFQDEVSILDNWIREGLKDSYCRFSRKQISYPTFDPSVVSGDLGDDQVKAVGYLVRNLKAALPHLHEWYAESDTDMNERKELLQYMEYLLTNKVREVANTIGGCYLRDVKMGDGTMPYEMVPKKQQQAAVKFLIDLAKDLSWWDDAEIMKELEIMESKKEGLRSLIVSTLFSRMIAVSFCSEKPSRTYTIREYMDDLYRWVWDGTLQNRALRPEEIDLQRSFLNSVINTSTVSAAPATLYLSKNALAIPLQTPLAMQYGNGIMEKLTRRAMMPERAGFYPAPGIRQNNTPVSSIYYEMLLDIQSMLKDKVTRSSGETRKHYEYLLFKIKQSLADS